jgi:cell division protein FtsX
MNIHLRTTLDYIRRSPFQATAAIAVLTLTFFVGTLLAILIYSSGRVLTYFETRPQIIAFLKDTAGQEDIANLQHALSGREGVAEVKYVSKEEALGIYKKATSDNPLLGELVSPSIFPASLELQVTNLSYAQPLITDIKDEPVVDSVGFTASLGGEKTLGNVVNRLKNIILYARIGGGVLSGVLIASSLLVLLVVIGMRLATRREEVEILNLIGATAGFIRSPIILEAVFYAAIGVFLGWIFSLIVILYSAPSLIAYFGEIPVLPKDTLSFFLLFGAILAIEITVGLLLALSGSLLAVSRIKKSR